MTAKNYDVIVIGGGHSGIEASLAAARLGCQVCMCTGDIDTIGIMPCNPSIGGPAKGQIVGEIDALGGEMGRASDATFIQMRVLNRSRGPAVQCLRSQNDKPKYNLYMKNTILSHENITVHEGIVDDVIIEGNRVTGVRTDAGVDIMGQSVIVTTGTFLKGKIHIGLSNESAGRFGEKSAEGLSASLMEAGLRLGRLKTGTPPRLHKNSIDYDQMILQPGDPEFLHFSFRTSYNEKYLDQVPCHLTYTTTKTHELILNNLDESPMFQKVIEGTGARYCPSIEDKVYRFKDKDSHQIFIEPESLESDLMYPAGLNTSLPAHVQDAFLRTIPGLEHVEVIRDGYAVEYDFVYPDQLLPTLETRDITGLYCAGQVNGTSGYEEAACQGLIAGINAGLAVQGRAPFILKRENSFIGTLIDDLISKDVHEPYRMLTSRSEFRLLLRQDNAPFRLSEMAHEMGLLSADDIDIVRDARQRMDSLKKQWKKGRTNASLNKKFNLAHSKPLDELLKRPDTDLNTLIEQDIFKSEDPGEIELAEKALVEIKYEGYVKKQEREIEKIKRYEEKKIPAKIDFNKIQGLKTESREKFERYKPATIYDAKRIAGINPADIMVLITHLEKYSIKDLCK